MGGVEWEKNKKRRRVCAMIVMSEEEMGSRQHDQRGRGRGWILLEEEERRTSILLPNLQ